jgi:hypothetical protein
MATSTIPYNNSPHVPRQAVSRPQLRCAYEASAPVWEAAEALEGDRAALAELQAAHGVDCPLELDLRLAGEQRLGSAPPCWSAAIRGSAGAAPFHRPDVG